MAEQQAATDAESADDDGDGVVEADFEVVDGDDDNDAD
jgi:hypothetical protein